MRRLIAVFAFGAAVAGCAESVTVIAPPPGVVQQNPVGFTVRFHQRANISTFTATVEAPAGSGIAPVDVTGDFSGPLTPGGQSTASVTLPQTSCPTGVPVCAHDRTFRVQALMSPRQAFDVTGHGEPFRLAGSTTPAPPPGPFIGLDAPTSDLTVNWGSTAAYVLEVESGNGFTGTVDIEAQNLPAGATASTVPVPLAAGATAQATLPVGTATATTALGQHTLRARATASGVGARTQNLTMRVLPLAGTFGSLTWRTSSFTCNGSNGFTINANVVGTVSFQGAGISTTGIPVLWYAFTPDCRGAVVIGPSAGPNAGLPANIFNFRFPSAIGANPGTSRSLSLQAWDQTQFRVAVDGSFLIATSASGSGRHASLWNMVSLTQINPPRQYSIAATLTAEIAGTTPQVAVTPTVGNAFTWNLP